MSSRPILPETQLHGRLAAIDPALVDRVAQGERVAFDSIFDALFPLVWALSVHNTGFLQHDAERLTKRILERVVVGLPGYPQDVVFAKWLRALIDDELDAFARTQKRRVTSQRSPAQPRP